MIPRRLEELAYEPFIALLRANMRASGALRIDHAMGLMRLFWIPPDMPAAEGTYVHYPLRDLLAILALESQRNQCLVIGEDLGTVPDELARSARAARRAVLSPAAVREGDRRQLTSCPSNIRGRRSSSPTTHDLPTLPASGSGTTSKCARA